MKSLKHIAGVLVITIISNTSLYSQPFPSKGEPLKPRGQQAQTSHPTNNATQGNENSHLYASINFGSPWPSYNQVQPYNNYGGGYGNAYYNNNYGNYGSYYNSATYYRRIARKTIRRTAFILHAAIQDHWMDLSYNPLLSKAVWHQRHSKFLYYNGDFMGAIHHARRAGYLAQESIQYNDFGYYNGNDDFGYADPGYGNSQGGNEYDDDYYRKNNTSSDGNLKEGDVYRKKVGENSEQSKSQETMGRELKSEKYKSAEMDSKIENKVIQKEEMKELKISDLDVNDSK